jgi:hypothetical protein
MMSADNVELSNVQNAPSVIPDMDAGSVIPAISVVVM